MPFTTLGAPWIADEASKRQSRSPVAALKAMKYPSYVPTYTRRRQTAAAV
jgi:hypothetical protein